MASSLICSETQSRVSSVLNRDVKQFGKKYMFDSNEEACWNSDQNSLNSSGNGQGVESITRMLAHIYSNASHSCQVDWGDSQWVTLEFPQPVRVSELKVQFQGGFSGKTCKLEGCPKDGDLAKIIDFYPEDSSSLQSFPIQEAPTVHRLKIVFENSADFFGRIIVYSLDILGERAL